MTIEYAESFFAWDVLSWLFLAILLAIVIVLIDLLFFSKTSPESEIKVTEERSTFSKICYFLIFLKFSKSEKYSIDLKLFNGQLSSSQYCCWF